MRICRLGFLFSLLLFIISCSEGDFTVFYQVINEKAIQDNDLDNTLTVQSMVRVNLSGWSQPDRYYIAAGKVFTREVASDNWDSVSNQTNNDERLCNGLALINNRLVGSFYSVDGKHYGLYTVPIDATFAASPKDITWVPVADPHVTGKQTGNLKTVGSYLFVSLSDGDTYSLAYTSDGINFSIVNFDGSPDLSNAVHDLTSGGGNYWYITGSTIYRGGAIGSVTHINDPDMPTRNNGELESFQGIIHTDDGQVYVSSSRGHIWLWYDAGTTWDPDGPAHFNYQASTVVNDDVWFTKFLEVPDTGSVTPMDMVVVGTHGAGFFEIDEDQGLSGIERFANTSKQELYSGSSGGFFVDDQDNNAFFVLTLGSGLWQSRLKDGDWESWIWE